MIVDTHAHLQFRRRESEKEAQQTGSFVTSFDDLADVLERAHEAGVTEIINVGVTPEDSREALRLAQDKQWAAEKTGVRMYATAGVHPHEASLGDKALDIIHDMAEDVVAIGECGLDYFHNDVSAEKQEYMLRMQIEIALEHGLPVVFHVRDAWVDFFRIVADYPRLRGVIHSFTGHVEQVGQALEHQGELYFGLNGIMTFTKDEAQLEAARQIPRERLLLETDCPFLAPTPYRGKRNEPAYLPYVDEFLATLYGLSADDLAKVTTQNAYQLFDIGL